jgi:hypothetical protein
MHPTLGKLCAAGTVRVLGRGVLLTLREVDGWLGDTETSLHAFTVGISYEGNLFE